MFVEVSDFPSVAARGLSGGVAFREQWYTWSSFLDLRRQGPELRRPNLFLEKRWAFKAMRSNN